MMSGALRSSSADSLRHLATLFQERADEESANRKECIEAKSMIDAYGCNERKKTWDQAARATVEMANRIENTEGIV